MDDFVVIDRKARQAIYVWIAFFVATVLMNGTILFAIGVDTYDWTYSTLKRLLFNSVDYAGFFLVVPLILTKGWDTVRKPSFLLPMTAAAASVILWSQIYYIATIAIVVCLYLHWRFDLSEIGFRTKGWKGDMVAILLFGVLGLLQALLSPRASQISVFPALSATVFRLFGNPASTVENLFYFGFLTERLGRRYNSYAVPLLIGALYAAHEISNPEYWYGGLSFGLVFVGMIINAAIYLWRRNVGIMWLGNGPQWFLSRIFGA